MTDERRRTSEYADLDDASGVDRQESREEKYGMGLCNEQLRYFPKKK